MKADAKSGRYDRRLVAPLILMFTLVPALVLFFHSTKAESAHPGVNGKIVFETSRDGFSEIYSMNADGSGPMKLTDNGATLDIDPACSPDGTKIAWSRDAGINAEIWVMNADGSGQTRLTTDTAWDVTPTWSPDGTKIAFASDRAGGGNWEVYVMNANGSAITRLTNSLGNDGGPTWSPDGTKIAFNSTRDGGEPEIYVMDAAGTNQTRLTNNPAWDAYPDWSPDGTRIAFESRRDGNDEIYWIQANGLVWAKVTNDPLSDETMPAWSPDGQQIAYVSNRDGDKEIYAISNPGNLTSPETNLTNDSDNLFPDSNPDWQPALAPAATVTPPGANGKIIFKKSNDIYSITADGLGPQTNLTPRDPNNPNSQYNGDAAFSPDGGRIVFYSTRTGSYELFTMNADGTNQTQLTNSPGDETDPVFSPDGTRIAFVKGSVGNYQICIMNADGSNPVQLTTTSGYNLAPAFSPDGSRIVFESDRNGDLEIYVMNVDGSVETRLTTNPFGHDVDPSFSPDGRQIVFSTTRDGNLEVYRMNTDGTGQTNLSMNAAGDTDPCFSPDGTKIAFSSYRNHQGQSFSEIFTMNADGTAQAKLTTNPDSIWGDFEPAWQPLPNYHWTWYDDIGGNNWVLMGNPASASQGLTYQLSIGGINRDLSAFSNGAVAPGASITPYYGDMGGPVVATSSTGGRGIVSQRILWPRGGSSLEEVLGTDRGKLSSNFFWTWYDQLSSGYQNWIMIANPSATETVRAEVLIAGQPMQNRLNPASPDYLQYYFEIAPGANVTPTFPGIQNGPVEVRAYKADGLWNTPADRRVVMASQRVLSGNGSAFNEAVGVPAEELVSDYYWPWYDDVNGLNWLMMSNPDVAPVTYRIDIGGGCDMSGVWNGTPNTICQSGTINGGEINYQRLGVVNGPVHVYTLNGGRIIASQRILFGSSFGETMGYPAADLSSTYHWTWYDQQTTGMANWVMIANPSTTQTIDVQVWMSGQQAEENIGPSISPTTWTLAPGERITPRFGSYIGGPVEVRAYMTGSTTTLAPGGAIVSQRVLYNGFFNEVLGTVIN